jgi:penicillin-binding protein 2
LTHKDQQICFQKRTFLLIGGKALLSSLLLGRLCSLQIFEKNKYCKLSEKNRIFSCFISPTRGRFFDAKGILIAGNKAFYQVFLNIHSLEESEGLLEKLEQILDIDKEQIAERIESNIKRRRNQSLLIKDHISWEEFSKLELYMSSLPGLSFEKFETRIYPYPHLMCHVLGYLGSVSQGDMERDESLADIPSIKIGKSGLEKTFDTILRGIPGSRQIEMNAQRRPVRTLGVVQGIPGQDVTLTLDFSLQGKIYNLLQEKTRASSCVVMRADTGAIVSYVSYPGFDSNLFHGAIRSQDWLSLQTDPRRPLYDRVSQGLYPPGSTYKMIVALAALKKGVIDEKTTFFCPGHFDGAGRRFYCWAWKKNGHGYMHLRTALAASCDVYFFYLAQLLDVDEIAEMSHLFGLGQLTGIEISGEKKGLVPTRDWKKKRKNHGWSLGENLNLSIGQGYLLSTPLQLTQMMAMLVNGGYQVKPHLCEQGTPAQLNLGVPSQHLYWMLEGMAQSVNEGYGTSYGSRVEGKSWKMGGKSGTSQVVSISQRERQLKKLDVLSEDLLEHALFLGYAPTDKPKFVTSIIVDHGGGGGKVAAPLAREVLTYLEEEYV